MAAAQGSAQIGVTGLGVMGRNLARNFARHGYTVALHNRTASRTTDVVSQFGHEGTFVPAQTAEEFVQALEKPRRLIIMVNAGAATDAVIDEFAPLLESGDMIIDGGNAHFTDTRRREAKLKSQNLHFVGMGVSGGEEGALNGPSIMPGGSTESYQALGPMLETISAHVDGTPCCTHVGPDGAGHFVKMVHNGIEYADMQLIAEAYDLLRTGLGAEPARIAALFRTWNEGDLESFLIEITADVLAQSDAATGRASCVSQNQGLPHAPVAAAGAQFDDGNLGRNGALAWEWRSGPPCDWRQLLTGSSPDLHPRQLSGVGPRGVRWRRARAPRSSRCAAALVRSLLLASDQHRYFIDRRAF